jgi:hypothetical protein
LLCLSRPCGWLAQPWHSSWLLIFDFPFLKSIGKRPRASMHEFHILGIIIQYSFKGHLWRLDQIFIKLGLARKCTFPLVHVVGPIKCKTKNMN